MLFVEESTIGTTEKCVFAWKWTFGIIKFLHLQLLPKRNNFVMNLFILNTYQIGNYLR